mgnify:CR=1 FL=1
MGSGSCSERGREAIQDWPLRPNQLPYALFKPSLSRSCLPTCPVHLQMYMGNKKKERIKLVGRRGFARIALEEQVDGIVCVYYFGQSQVLDFGPSWLADFSRRMRTSFGYLTGWMGLPVPRPIPIYVSGGVGGPGLVASRFHETRRSVYSMWPRSRGEGKRMATTNTQKPYATEGSDARDVSLLLGWRPHHSALPVTGLAARAAAMLAASASTLPPLLVYTHTQMVNGKPIPVPKVARDSPEFDKEVDKLLDATITELGEMYNRHRGEYGWGDRPLSIE